MMYIDNNVDINIFLYHVITFVAWCFLINQYQRLPLRVSRHTACGGLTHWSMGIETVISGILSFYELTFDSIFMKSYKYFHWYLQISGIGGTSLTNLLLDNINSGFYSVPSGSVVGDVWGHLPLKQILCSGPEDLLDRQQIVLDYQALWSVAEATSSHWLFSQICLKYLNWKLLCLNSLEGKMFT